MRSIKVEISSKTIVFTVLFILLLFLLWQVKGVLALFFICFVFMELLNPSVTRLEQKKIPRPLAIVMIYILILLVTSFGLASIVPIFIKQTAGLINTLPQALSDFEFLGFTAIDISAQMKIIENLPSNIAQTIISVFSNLFSVFLVFVITFYLLMERKKLSKYNFNFFGENGQDIVPEIIENTERRLGRWFNARILVMIAIGLLSYLGFALIGLPYAVPLAIFACFLEIIPNIGPTISGVAAGIVGLTVSPLMALLAVSWGIIVQQTESNIITPKIMKETIGLNPLITILTLAAGAKMAGVLGALLAIPIYLTVESIARSVIRERSKNKKLQRNC